MYPVDQRNILYSLLDDVETLGTFSTETIQKLRDALYQMDAELEEELPLT